LEFKTIAKNLGSPLQINIDQFYLTLYPESFEYMEDPNNPIYIERVNELSIELSNKSIEEACSKIVWVLEEAKLGNNPWPCLVPLLCNELAKNVENPIAYARKLIQSELPNEIIAPFFEIAVDRNHPEWRVFAETVLQSPLYYLIICNTVFSRDELPEDLLIACIDQLDVKDTEWIKFFCWQHNVPTQVIKKLLQHSNSEIAYSAAIGEWHSHPKGEIRDEIYELWENTIIKSPEDDIFIKEILVSNPSLAFQWLLNYFSIDHGFINHEMINPIAESIRVLDNNQRKDLLEKLIKSENKLEKKEKIISWIIGEDLDIFEYFLNLPINDKQKNFRVAPLQMLPNGNDWCNKTLIALENGVSEDDIIDASILGLFENVYTGPTSTKYKLMAEAYIPLKDHENEKIRKIAKIGFAIAEDRMSVHLWEEKSREEFE